MERPTNYPRKARRYTHEGGIFNRLPIELQRQIFTLLPVKSLLILRSVCKSFASIINDSDFASFHFRNFPANSNENRLLAVEESTYSVHEIVNNDSVVITDEIIATEIWIVALLNGLLLLRDIEKQTFVLWNPSIRKRREVSFPSVLIRHLGFGYHSEDYKVVGLTSVKGVAWVYSVEKNSWREILNSGFRCDYWRENEGMYSESLSMKEGVFWIEIGRGSSIRFECRLVWFNFGTERFRYVDKMPYSSGKQCTYTGLVKLDGGSSVGVCGVDVEDRAFVWTLEIDTMSWIVRYKIARDLLAFNYEFKNVMIVERNRELVWKYWTYVNGNLNVLSYDIETRSIKDKRRFPVMDGWYLGTYFESLVLLDSSSN